MKYKMAYTAFVILGLIHSFLFIREKYFYPKLEKLTISNGIIHHPVYGDYPLIVNNYEIGSILFPGQIIGSVKETEITNVTWTTYIELENEQQIKKG